MALQKDELRRALETYRSKNPVNLTSPTPQQNAPQAQPSFDDRRNQLVNQMMNQAQAAPPQMNVPSPYQGFNPQANAPYQAALREANRNAQTAGNNAMVQMGSRGIGNSSITTDRVAQIQQNALGRVSDTLLPQYEQMDYGRYRDQVGDQFRVDEVNYARGQDQYNRSNQLAQFMAGLSQQELDNQFRSDSFREQQRQSNIGNALNLSQLFGTSVQPKESGQALFDQVSGMNTLAGQQMQYQQLRDQIADERYRQQFDEDVRRFGLQYAADQAYRQGQLSISQQNVGISQQNADRLAEQQRIDNLYRQWQMTGQAPEGIPGVQAGTTTPSDPERPSQNDMIADYVDGLNSVPPTMHKEILQNRKSDIIRDIGVSNYNTLYKMYVDPYTDLLD